VVGTQPARWFSGPTPRTPAGMGDRRVMPVTPAACHPPDVHDRLHWPSLSHILVLADLAGVPERAWRHARIAVSDGAKWVTTDSSEHGAVTQRASATSKETS